MSTRTLLLAELWLVGLGTASIAQASGVVCTLTPGNSLTQTAEPCGQAMFATTDFLNWGHPVSPTGYSGFGEPTNPPSNGPFVATSSGGLGVTLSSGNMGIERADNTVYAWSNIYGWTSPTLVAGHVINAFGGHFGAPATPTSTPPFGDNLMGVVASAGSTASDASLSLSFSHGISGVGFEVSSLYLSNFIATLKAFDSGGNLIGTYIVNTNGTSLGGACAGLQQPIHGGNPIPCNDAPTVQIADALGRIKSVLLVVNDSQGAFIDQLSLNDGSGVEVPEPALGAMAGIGICVFALLARRKRSPLAQQIARIPE